MNQENQVGAINMQRKFFTLIEVVTVIAIIVILTGLILGASSAVKRLTLKRNCKAQLSTIETILQQYKSAWGFFPESPEDAGSSNTPPDTLPMALDKDWWDSIETVEQKELVDQETLQFKTDPVYKYVDVWGNPFWYQSPTATNMMNPEYIDLWSMGHDGEHGEAGLNDDGAGSADDAGDAQSFKAKDSDDITNWGR